jgi:hypothetical protein
MGKGIAIGFGRGDGAYPFLRLYRMEEGLLSERDHIFPVFA